MRKRTIIRVSAGLGLGAALLLGCQNSVEQKSDATSTSATNTALLQLAVKDSGACVDLKSRCLRAHAAGNDSDSLVTNLVDSCILDTAAAHRILGEEGHGRHGDADDSDDIKLDSLRIKPDSTAMKALCDSLTTVLAGADSTGAGYASIKHMALEACEEHPLFPPEDHGFGGPHGGRGHHGGH